MNRQALVIGLGQFGMSVARALSDKGVEVLAIDTSEDRIDTAAHFVDKAIVLDASNESSLAQASPELRDICVCAIGENARESSIICTALLRQLGARRVVSRASDDLHARILTLVGAHEVVNPEREYGSRFATQILHHGIRGEMPLGGGLFITEAVLPPAFVGRTLSELQLPRRFGLTVVAIRHDDGADVSLPNASATLGPRDVLVVVAKADAVARMFARS